MRHEQIGEAYDYCRQVTQQASKTFYWGSVFLPPPKRRAVWAVYALCRVVDDIVDETVNREVPRVGHLRGSNTPEKELDYWRHALEHIYQRGGTDDGPVQRAWSDMIEHYPVPLQPVLE